jgi:hypothetical protein
LLSAVTAWEIALLVDTSRIELDIPPMRGSNAFSPVPASRRCRCPTRPPAAAIGCIISSTATRRTATAIELACPLVSYDDRIAGFGEQHGRQYRFAVGS